MPHADWEATHPLLLVGKHFATKGLLIVGVWGVKHLLWKHGNKRQGEKAPGCEDLPLTTIFLNHACSPHE